MASILDFLNSDTGKNFIQRSSSKIGESPQKVESALGMALPMLLGAMKKNAESEEGATKLNRELEKEKHDGSIIGNLGEKLSGAGFDNILSEGSGILGHIFGSKQKKVEEAVSTSTGIETSKISQLLKMAAPVIMGILGSQKRKDNIGKGGVSGLLGSVLGTNSSHDQSLLETFMDADDDGNAVNDIAGKIFGKK